MLGHAIHWTPFTMSNWRNTSWAAEIESFPLISNFSSVYYCAAGRKTDFYFDWWNIVVLIMDFDINFYVTIICSFCINLGHAIIPPSLISKYEVYSNKMCVYLLLI